MVKKIRCVFFFFSSRRRHTRCGRDWSSDVCSSDLVKPLLRTVTFPQAAVVLALAQGSVRLIEVAPDVPAETIRVAELPSDAASAVRKASITDRTASGRIQGSEGQKVYMRQYSRLVDRAV